MAASVTLSEAAPRTLRCSICEGSEIDAPPGSTPATRFYCRYCMARIAEQKSIEDGRAFGAGEHVLLEQLRERMLRRTVLGCNFQKDDVLVRTNESQR